MTGFHESMLDEVVKDSAERVEVKTDGEYPYVVNPDVPNADPAQVAGAVEEAEQVLAEDAQSESSYEPTELSIATHLNAFLIAELSTQVADLLQRVADLEARISDHNQRSSHKI